MHTNFSRLTESSLRAGTRLALRIVTFLKLDRVPNILWAHNKYLFCECIQTTLVLSSEVIVSLEEQEKFTRWDGLPWAFKNSDNP